MSLINFCKNLMLQNVGTTKLQLPNCLKWIVYNFVDLQCCVFERFERFL